MVTHRLILILAIGAITAIAIYGAISFPLYISQIVIGIGALSALRFKPKHRAVVLACFCGMQIGLWRCTTLPPIRLLPSISKPVRVEVIGVITDRQIQSTRIGYRIQGQVQIADHTLISGDVWLWDSIHWPAYEVGKRIRSLAIQAPLQDESMEHWYVLQGVIGNLKAKNISITGTVPVPRWQQWLINSRQWVQDQAGAILPEPGASLLVGLLTGDRSRIPKSVVDAFRSTGLTHLLAVSGGNVSMVLVIANLLLFWLPIRYRLIPMLLTITWFAIFTGLSASVVRASIMSGIATLALCHARPNSGWRNVVMAACVMALQNPRIVWWDIGFQLSFLSVLGLLTFGSFFQKQCTWLNEKYGIRESLAMTLAAQMGTEPCVLYHFGQLSLISPFANMLVTPLIPIISTLGGVSIALRIFSPTLALLPALGTQLCLWWVTTITYFLSQIPFASVHLEMSVWMIAVLYLGIVVFGLKIHACLKLRYKTGKL